MGNNYKFKISKNWDSILSLEDMLSDAKFIFMHDAKGGHCPLIVLNTAVEGIDAIEISYDKEGLLNGGEAVFSEGWGERIIDSSQNYMKFIHDFLIEEGAKDLIINY